jgi:hypothetical protein
MLETFVRFADQDAPLSKYFPRRDNSLSGSVVKYDVLQYQERVHGGTARGGPAPVGVMPIRGKVTMEGVTIKEKLPLDPEVLKDMVDVGSLTETQREAEVGRAIRQLRRNMDSTWQWFYANMLTAGALCDADNVAPPADMTAVNGHFYLWYEGMEIHTTLDVDMFWHGGNIDDAVARSWADPEADIKGELDAARDWIAINGGVDANRVILNPTTMGYIHANNMAQDSNWAKDQYAQRGTFRELWDYTFDVIGTTYGAWGADVSPRRFNIANSARLRLIPDNLVILTTANNEDAGRAMIDCEPIDTRAARGARGVFLWTDEDPEHPHGLTPGAEWTGIPMCKNPNASYVFTDVTNT